MSLFKRGEDGTEIFCELEEFLLTQLNFTSFDKWSVLLVPLSCGNDFDGCVLKKGSSLCALK